MTDEKFSRSNTASNDMRIFNSVSETDGSCLRKLEVNKKQECNPASSKINVILSLAGVLTSCSDSSPLQHIDKVFKHKELQQQLMDAKLQRITEMMKEVEEKQQRERDFVSASLPLTDCSSALACIF